MRQDKNNVYLSESEVNSITKAVVLAVFFIITILLGISIGGQQARVDIAHDYLEIPIEDLNASGVYQDVYVINDQPCHVIVEKQRESDNYILTNCKTITTNKADCTIEYTDGTDF